MADTRGTIARAAAELLSRQGYAETTVAEVVGASRTPRGSLYHYYPGGKDDVVLDAVGITDAWMTGRLAAVASRRPADVVAGFLAAFRDILVPDASRGCPVATVVVDDPPEHLRERCAAILRHWRRELAARLADGGLADDDATALATLVVAACEGGVLVGRARRDVAAFDTVAAAVLGDPILRASEPTTPRG